MQSNILNLKDNRITFNENFYSEKLIKGFTYKVFEGYLSYQPEFCKFCGVLFLCKHCNHAFILSTSIVNDGCFISNNTKHHIVKNLTKKISEKDIALNNDVSHNTVKRIMDSYYDSPKIIKSFLPEVLSFDTHTI